MKPSTLADIFAGFRVALPMDVSINSKKFVKKSLKGGILNFLFTKGASFGKSQLANPNQNKTAGNFKMTDFQGLT